MRNLKKYFGINITSEEQGKPIKTITILEGRYIVKFKISAPFESRINKKGRVMGPFILNKRNTSAQKIKEKVDGGIHIIMDRILDKNFLMI